MMKWPGKRRKTATADWLKFATDKELEGLMGLTDLSKLGPLPPDAALLYQKIQARAKAKLHQSQTALALPLPDHVTIPSDMSFADWLIFKWQSADASFRNTLRTVADALGVSVPMSRTRKSVAGGKDSPPNRRSDSDQQPTHVEQAPLESAAETAEPGYHDPPEWHDEHADGWTPCESLHEAFRSDVDWH